MKGKARVFGRVWEDEKFHSLFVCSCGKRDWIVETEENTREIICKICEKKHYVKKNKHGYYILLKDE